MLILILLSLGAHFVYIGNWGMDFWEHCAVINSFISNPFYPVNHISGNLLPHAFFSPYHFALGFSGKMLDLDSFAMLRITSFTNFIVLILGFSSLTRYYMKPHHNSWGKSFFVFLILMLFFSTKPWVWSSFFSFKSIFYVLSYPSTLATGLIMILWSNWNILFNKSVGTFLLLGTCLSFIILIHPISILFLLTLIISETKFPLKLNIVTKYLLLSASVIFLLYLWPFYSFYELLLSPGLDKTQLHLDSEVLYNWPIIRLAPLFIIFPILVKILKQEVRIRRFILIALLLYLFGFVSGLYAYGRVLSFAIIMVFIAISINLNSQLVRKHKAFILVAIIFTTPLLFDSIKQTCQQLCSSRQDGLEYTVKDLGNIIPQKSIVLASEDIINYLPAAGIYVTASVFPAYWILDNGSRKQDLEQFFSNTQNPHQLRQIIKKYDAEYIVTKKGTLNDNTFFSDESSFQKIESGNNFKVIKILD